VFPLPTQLRPQDRKVALQAGLQRINEVFCHGSNHTYLPIGTGNNRIIRIHYDKAKPFSTKSRVPCFVVFEVIDYDLAQRIRFVWRAVLEIHILVLACRDAARCGCCVGTGRKNHATTVRIVGRVFVTF
jgi:hypothetical protein